MGQPLHHRLLLLSVLVAVATMGLKVVAWLVTDSVSLFSDAAESLVNLVAALIASFSLWYASQPADAGHAYGHEKIEYFASGAEGSLIILAAGTIAWQAVLRLLRPEELARLDLGLVLSLVAAGLNGLVGWWLVRVGRRDRALVLEADGQHLLTDVWTSVGVAAGLLAVLATGFQWLDPIIALLVAAQVFWTGSKIVRRSFKGLMDSSLPPAEVEGLRQMIQENLGPGMTFHALRTREAGARRLIDFHLLVPGAMTVLDAHAFADELEARLEATWTPCEVTIHLEPIEAETSWLHNPMKNVEAASPPPAEAGLTPATSPPTPTLGTDS